MGVQEQRGKVSATNFLTAGKQNKTKRSSQKNTELTCQAVTLTGGIFVLGGK